MTGATFGRLLLGTSNVVCRSACGLAVAYGELRPILPGHTLVAPARPVARLGELSLEELTALFETVRSAQAIVGPAHGATAFNLAVKDGAAAGPPSALAEHVHVHVVPRSPGQFGDGDGDQVYGMIDRWSPEGDVNEPPPLEFPPDEQRRRRTEEEMAEEARAYADADASADRGALPTSAVTFGEFELRPSQVFATSPSGLSMATVNLKPLVPGHVLVIPKRRVPTLAGLAADELADLCATTRRVQGVVCAYHGATAATLGVQDGADAGQSVPHVHVHILPR